jgi:hypothetical protein
MKRKAVLGLIVIVLFISAIMAIAFFPSSMKQIVASAEKMKKIDRVALVAAGIKNGDAEYRIAKNAETGEDHVVLVRPLQSGEYEILQDLGTIE